MARYLSYFTTVGDEQPVDFEDEELHVTSEELSPATGQFPTTINFRDSLRMLYSSQRFQVFVVCLVILDAIFVLVELLIELSIIQLGSGHLASEVFHYLSLALLTFFIMELLDAFNGMGLLILLRLWRVARIINGILVSVKTRAHQRIHKLKESYDHLVQNVTELQERTDKLVISYTCFILDHKGSDLLRRRNSRHARADYYYIEEFISVKSSGPQLEDIETF
ncbi:voltage-gated hydrogen channel 1 isoform X3 [Cottoperca gobio]|uniref:Voltage-gated hydrogen channel 1 isoform X3 n=1 Tax=Cottoperca gobio TaxID=56716 RepID=A0A6J2QGX2_COTGO|nr:voltage-gated hydrogen channel 1 isoform X3 [Cottoperca gobio]